MARDKELEAATAGPPVVGFLESPPAAIRISFTVCQNCFAIIPREDLLSHSEWHERLRRAVDEVGTLG